MKEVGTLRKEAKKYIDTADERVVKMVHALLEADRKDDFWDELSEPVKADVEEAIEQSARGEGRPHKEIMKKYSKWLTK